MSTATLNAGQHPPEQAELVPQYFDTDLIVTPHDNPAHPPSMLADLYASIRENGQRLPGYVCPSPDLPPNKRLCIEGNGRLAVARQLGRPFWAFDLGRPVSEEERIKLTFSLNLMRRAMRRDEIAERGARFMELIGCSQGDAARLLNVSQATLSRAFGERRIPPDLKPRADRLGLAIRSLVAAAPEALMAKVIDFAETPGQDGKQPTRDEVVLFIQRLKKGGKPNGRKAKPITLTMNGRAVTFAVGEKDTSFTVADDLKAIATRLGKLEAVPPDGWPFLFH